MKILMFPYGTEALWISASFGMPLLYTGIGNGFRNFAMKMWAAIGWMVEQEAGLKSQFRINKIRDIMYLARSYPIGSIAIAELKGLLRHIHAPPYSATEEEKKLIRNALSEFRSIVSILWTIDCGTTQLKSLRVDAKGTIFGQGPRWLALRIRPLLEARKHCRKVFVRLSNRRSIKHNCN
jgi:hypothetical protein